MSVVGMGLFPYPGREILGRESPWWQCLRPWSKEILVWDCCNHRALGHGCSPPGLTCLPTHPSRSALCASSVFGTLPPSSIWPTGRDW
jgi:hypothetical protein